MCLYILVSIILLAAQSAKADILFIDLNSSSSELSAIQEAAQLRQEKVIILPPRTPLQQRDGNTAHQIEFQVDSLDDQVHSLKIQLKDLKDQDKQSQLQAQIDTLKTKIAGLNKQKEQLLSGSVPNYSTKDLDQLLQSYNSSPAKKISAIVISGHHVTDYFGIFGELSLSSIHDVFARYPRLLKEVHSAYGWGCYTATPERAMEWRDSFPSVGIIGGFDASAPGAGRLADGEFLKGILVKEHQLSERINRNLSARDERSVIDSIKAIVKLPAPSVGFV